MVGRFARALTWGHESDAARGSASGKRDAHLGGRSQRGGDTGHHFHAYAAGPEVAQFLVRAAEKHRITALEPHDHRVFARGVCELLVDEALCSRMPAGALADRDLLGPRG